MCHSCNFYRNWNQDRKEDQITVSMKAGSSNPALGLCQLHLAGQLWRVPHWSTYLPKLSLLTYHHFLAKGTRDMGDCRHCPRKVLQDISGRPIPPSILLLSQGTTLLVMHV